MISYPTDFPVTESVQIVQIVRQGKSKEQLPLLAKSLWVIQGYAQGKMLGEAASDLSLFTVPEDFDAIAVLEKLNAASEEGAVSIQFAVPWLLILRWALEELIEVLVTA